MQTSGAIAPRDREVTFSRHPREGGEMESRLKCND